MTKIKKFYVESELVFKEKSKHGLFEDLTGQKFGRLTVIGFAGSVKKRSYWYCKCDCENISMSAANNLKRGDIKSCGCFRIERTKEIMTTHGHTSGVKESATYVIWCSMIARCYNTNNKRFHDYGGRGITVCERWRKFENFLEDMGDVPDGLSIDRINNNGNYEPGNCRWATMKEQCNNKRNNHLLTYNGKTQTVTQWERELGFKRWTIFTRLKRGWSIERALSE